MTRISRIKTVHRLRKFVNKLPKSWLGHLWFVLVVILASCQSATSTPDDPVPLILEGTSVEPAPTPTVTRQSSPFPTLKPTQPANLRPVPVLSGTITLWHAWDENEASVLSALIEEFEDEHPNVDVEATYVPFEDLRDKFEASGVSGNGPTLLIGPTEWGPALFDASLLKDITPLANPNSLSTIHPVALNGVRYRSALVGLPLTFSSGVILFRNNSVLPIAPASFDELVENARQITSGNLVGAYLDYSFTFSGGHLAGLGGQLLDESGLPRFNSAKGLEWANLLTRFREAGPVDNGTDADVEFFKSGKVGAIIDGSWNIGDMVEAIGQENLAIDPWPEPLSGYVWTEGVYLSVTATDEEAAAGWALMEQLLSFESQAIIAELADPGRVPVVFGLEIDDPLMEQLVEAFSSGVAVPGIPQMDVYWDPMNEAVVSIVEDSEEAALVLPQAEAEIIARLDEMDEDD